MAYFKRLQQLLQLEREADRASYKQLTEHASVTARREAGTTW